MSEKINERTSNIDVRIYVFLSWSQSVYLLLSSLAKFAGGLTLRYAECSCAANYWTKVNHESKQQIYSIWFHQNLSLALSLYGWIYILEPLWLWPNWVERRFGLAREHTEKSSSLIFLISDCCERVLFIRWVYWWTANSTCASACLLKPPRIIIAMI